MTARIIDGRALAAAAKERVKERAEACTARGRQPRLDAVLVGVGDTPARIYALNQARTCEAVGIDYTLHELPGDAGQDRIFDEVARLNDDPGVSSIMIHLPLPSGIDPEPIQERISPDKDVEGVTPTNIGNVVFGRSELAPCTASAAIRLLESTGEPLRGRRVVVIGAGPIVGRPIAALLMQREATVISANRFTDGLDELCRSADVIVAAAGVPGLVSGAIVRPGALVVDVGVNRVEGPDGKTRTVGDVAFDEVLEVAGWLSPVPGGVGPMTVAVLLTNVVDATERALDRTGPGEGR